MPVLPNAIAAVHFFPHGKNQQLTLPARTDLPIAGALYHAGLQAGFFRKAYATDAALSLIVHDPTTARQLAAALRIAANELDQQASALDAHTKKGL